MCTSKLADSPLTTRTPPGAGSTLTSFTTGGAGGAPASPPAGTWAGGTPARAAGAGASSFLTGAAGRAAGDTFGAGAVPDQSSLVGFGDEAETEAFCASPNLPRFGPWDIQGNIQVQVR